MRQTSRISRRVPGRGALLSSLHLLIVFEGERTLSYRDGWSRESICSPLCKNVMEACRSSRQSCLSAETLAEAEQGHEVDQGTGLWMKWKLEPNCVCFVLRLPHTRARLPQTPMLCSMSHGAKCDKCLVSKRRVG